MLTGQGRPSSGWQLFIRLPASRTGWRIRERGNLNGVEGVGKRNLLVGEAIQVRGGFVFRLV